MQHKIDSEIEIAFHLLAFPHQEKPQMSLVEGNQIDGHIESLFSPSAI